MPRTAAALLVVAMLASCGEGRSFEATDAATGSALLDPRQAIRVASVVRIHEPLPESHPEGGEAIVVWGEATFTGPEGADARAPVWLVALPQPGDPPIEARIIDSQLRSTLPVQRGADGRLVDCGNGVCAFRFLAFFTPELSGPVQVDWSISAHAGSIEPLGDPAVEVEVEAVDVVAAHQWFESTEATVARSSGGQVAGAHFTAHVPPDWVVDMADGTASWLQVDGYPAGQGSSRVLLDRNASTDVATDGGVWCPRPNSCTEIGFAVATQGLPPGATPETVVPAQLVGYARGVATDIDIPPSNPRVELDARTDPGEQAQRRLASTLEPGTPRDHLNVEVKLDYPRRRPGWPVVAVATVSQRGEGLDEPSRVSRSLLVDCRDNPCTDEFTVGVDGHATGPVEVAIEVTVVPWEGDAGADIQLEIRP